MDIAIAVFVFVFASVDETFEFISHRHLEPELETNIGVDRYLRTERRGESRHKTYKLTKTEIQSNNTVAKKRLTVSNLARAVVVFGVPVIAEATMKWPGDKNWV